jgi:predicted ATPase
LIVENPEAHLHPAGQSRLGRFLARIAGSGSQVVIETHSDHVINGVRLAVADDRVINADDAFVHFFTGGADGTAIQIELTAHGGLTAWPPGFFDQIERDLGELSRAKRRGD